MKSRRNQAIDPTSDGKLGENGWRETYSDGAGEAFQGREACLSILCKKSESRGSGKAGKVKVAEYLKENGEASERRKPL